VKPAFVAPATETRFPNTVLPGAAVNSATKQALAPPQFLTAPISRS
jgi:hypothetical protein